MERQTRTIPLRTSLYRSIPLIAKRWATRTSWEVINVILRHSHTRCTMHLVTKPTIQCHQLRSYLVARKILLSRIAIIGCTRTAAIHIQSVLSPKTPSYMPVSDPCYRKTSWRRLMLGSAALNRPITYIVGDPYSGIIPHARSRLVIKTRGISTLLVTDSHKTTWDI